LWLDGHSVADVLRGVQASLAAAGLDRDTASFSDTVEEADGHGGVAGSPSIGMSAGSAAAHKLLLRLCHAGCENESC
jgi:hypothetical protein